MILRGLKTLRPKLIFGLVYSSLCNVLCSSLCNVLCIGLVLWSLCSQSMATVGYFQLGHGGRSNAMAGASIAFVQDSIAIAMNPAGLSFLESGLDLSVMGFAPQRGASLDTTNIFGSKVTAESENPFFLAPNIGWAWHISSKFAVGVSLYSSGGMNTEYEKNLYHEAFAGPTALFSAAVASTNGFEVGGEEHEFVKSSFLNASNTGTLGVNLEQAVIAPSVSYQVNSAWQVGGSLLIGVQRFSATGLGDFVSFSNSPLQLSDRGPDYAMGFGVRVGTMYQVAKWARLGVVASSKIAMSRFEKYSGLFANEGNFDVPAHFGFGLALNPMKKLTFALDISHILYEGVNSVGNKGPNADQLLSGFQTALENGLKAQRSQTKIPVNYGATSALGRSDGYGFGWNNIWVFKLGAQYQLSDVVQLMAGYAYGQDPVADDQALFNLIAPAVVQHHLSAGLSYDLNAKKSLNLTYMKALKAEVNGTFQASPEASERLAGSADIPLSYQAEAWMSQDVFELSYQHKF